MKVENQSCQLPSFFKPIFWSYKFSSINPEKNSKRIIIDTINYGSWEHWLWVVNFYGKMKLKKIIEITPKTEFRKPALKLISLLLGIKKMKYESRSHYIKIQKNIS